MLVAIAAHKPDLYINAGDDNGSYWGGLISSRVSKLERLLLPSTIIAKVPGNHDYWLCPTGQGSGRRKRDKSGRPSVDVWQDAREKMFLAYKALGIHCFNQDGILRLGGWTFIGHSMWYEESAPATNDHQFMPIDIMGGNTNHHLYKEGYRGLWDQVDAMSLNPAGPVAVVSHFPIFGPRHDASGLTTTTEDDAVDPGHPTLASALMEHGAKAFLCGHMHQQHLGPIRFEAGSNQNVGGKQTPRYDHPRYLLLDFKDDGSVAVLKSVSLAKGAKPDY
jgi:hypothetical protein